MRENEATMLRITMNKSAAGAKKYYCEQYYKEGQSAQMDYYSEGDHAIGKWGGKAAMQLGLVGDIAKQDFATLYVVIAIIMAGNNCFSNCATGCQSKLVNFPRLNLGLVSWSLERGVIKPTPSLTTFTDWLNSSVDFLVVLTKSVTCLVASVPCFSRLEAFSIMVWAGAFIETPIRSAHNSQNRLAVVKRWIVFIGMDLLRVFYWE